MGLLRKKNSDFFGHTYAYTISGMVVLALLYTLFPTNDTDLEAGESLEHEQLAQSGTAILSNEFNYGFGKTPKPDAYLTNAYAPDIPITNPQWQTVTQTPVITPVEALVVATAQTTMPRIAIIIDDMGVRQNMTRPFANLPVQIDFSFLPYADGLTWQTSIMAEAGHELMLHMPMEPSIEGQNPGPKALLTNLSDVSLNERINWNLSRFQGFVGINNHMGSRFTEDEGLMSMVVERLKQQNLFFIDSRTTAKSTGFKMAKEHGLQYEDRDVFLDNVLTREAIFAQFAELERMALKNGTAIAIGHPHRETLAALQSWLPTLEARGFEVVKVSAMLKQQHQTIPVLTTEVNTPDAEAQRGYSLGGGGG